MGGGMDIPDRPTIPHGRAGGRWTMGKGRGRGEVRGDLIIDCDFCAVERSAVVACVPAASYLAGRCIFRNYILLSRSTT